MKTISFSDTIKVSYTNKNTAFFAVKGVNPENSGFALFLNML